MRDPNVLTIPQAAKLLGRDPQTIRNWLKDEDGSPSDFANAVVIDVPSSYVLISRPRLMRRLHGEAVAS